MGGVIADMGARVGSLVWWERPSRGVETHISAAWSTGVEMDGGGSW